MEENHNVSVQLKNSEYISEAKKKFRLKEYDIEDLDKYIEKTFKKLQDFMKKIFSELV